MSLPTALYWREPLWMLLVLLPLLLAALRQHRLQRTRRTLADEALLPWLQPNRENAAPLGLQLLSFSAWCLIAAALSGPRTAVYVPPELRTPAAKLILIKDLSGSMKATDLRIGGSTLRRRDAALGTLQQWNSQAADNLEIGLMVFAGQAHWLLKPSGDTELRAHFLDQLETLQAPTLGNNLAQALERAVLEALQPIDTGRLLVFTDGDIEAEQRQRASTSLTQLLDQSTSLRVTLVGVGSNEMSHISDGNMTQLKSLWLKQLAEHPRVDYLTLEQASTMKLSELLRLPSPRIDPAAHDQVLWSEWFAIPLVAALLLLILVLALSQQRSALQRRQNA